jgi:hypothetical protein
MPHLPASSDRGGTQRFASMCVLIDGSLSDTQLRRRVSQTYRCARCGHPEQATDAAQLRQQAKAHAETCEVNL